MLVATLVAPRFAPAAKRMASPLRGPGTTILGCDGSDEIRRRSSQLCGFGVKSGKSTALVGCSLSNSFTGPSVNPIEVTRVYNIVLIRYNIYSTSALQGLRHFLSVSAHLACGWSHSSFDQTYLGDLEKTVNHITTISTGSAYDWCFSPRPS